MTALPNSWIITKIYTWSNYSNVIIQILTMQSYTWPSFFPMWKVWKRARSNCVITQYHLKQGHVQCRKHRKSDTTSHSLAVMEDPYLISTKIEWEGLFWGDLRESIKRNGYALGYYYFLASGYQLSDLKFSDTRYNPASVIIWLVRYILHILSVMATTCLLST